MTDSSSPAPNALFDTATASLVDQYEHLWRRGRTPDPDEFLAQAGPLSPTALAAVLRADQRQRWQAGERILVEAYLQRYPAIAAEADHAADLIFNEYLLREKLGEKPDADEYARRFPQLAALLKAQIELHAALAMDPNPLTAPSSTPSGGADDSSLSEAGTLTAFSIRMGEMFGRYRILRSLGRGGMAEVYLAEDTQLGRQVALKIPHFGIGADAELRQRFTREARIAATFNHPHLAPIFDVGQVNGVDYLTMPVLSGETLATRIKRDGRFAERSAAQLALLVARAVHAAHKAAIIHRDLKPANVMLSANGEPIVMDFGLARRLASSDARLTATGMVLGTPAYIAPEQIGAETEALGPTCDVYSLGAILYELLTGALPFRGSVHEVLRQKLSQEPPSPSQHRPDLDPRLEHICLTAMASDPAARYASMETFAGALDAYLQGKSELHPLPMKARRRIPRRIPRRRLVAAGLACLGLLLAGILLWALSRPSSALNSGDGFPAGARWNGFFQFRPDYTGEVSLLVEQRDGDTFRGLYKTEGGKYVWRVRGTARAGQVAWEFVEVVREASTTEVVGNAAVEGTWEGNKMTVAFRHRLKGMTADMTLWRQE